MASTTALLSKTRKTWTFELKDKDILVFFVFDFDSDWWHVLAKPKKQTDINIRTGIGKNNSLTAFQLFSPQKRHIGNKIVRESKQAKCSKENLSTFNVFFWNNRMIMKWTFS
jgi:hypothetical protein